MRKYIDSIRVSDFNLAYTIVQALEKDDKYSVDFFGGNNGDPLRRRECAQEIELKVYRNEKVIPAQVMGFSEEKKDD